VEGEFIMSGLQCAICLVYAPNDHQDRWLVWNQLRGIRSFTATPLVMMGDFNEVLRPQERRGGKEVTQGDRYMAKSQESTPGDEDCSSVFLKHLEQSVGNGNKTRFWEDQWAGNFTLKENFLPSSDCQHNNQP